MKAIYDEITLDEDTTVHISGFPFMVKAGTVIYGRKENFALTKDKRECTARGGG